MHRTRILIVLLLGLLVALAASAPAQAQDPYRGTTTIDGEPTDLEGVLSVIGQATLDDNDVDATPPAGEADFDSWFEQILQILREMGLIPTGTG